MSRPLTLSPCVLHINKLGGVWEYQIRTARPHNPFGSLGSHVATVNPHFGDPEAIGHLLASAPDLRDALQGLLDCVLQVHGDPLAYGMPVEDERHPYHQTVAAARAAIAAATQVNREPPT